MDAVLADVGTGKGTAFFLNGSGGTVTESNVLGAIDSCNPSFSGKTFLYQTVMHILRGQGKIALAVAPTGIASTLLDGGRTLHSRFKLPVPFDEISVSTHYSKLTSSWNFAGCFAGNRRWGSNVPNFTSHRDQSATGRDHELKASCVRRRDGPPWRRFQASTPCRSPCISLSHNQRFHQKELCLTELDFFYHILFLVMDGCVLHFLEFEDGPPLRLECFLPVAKEESDRTTILHT